MWRSLFLSITSVAAGCGGDDVACGPAGAAADGLVASEGTTMLTFGNMVARAGNDCPAADAPAGVVSLTIEGSQVDGTGLITLCIPRPDTFGAGSHSLGGSQSTADVRIIDLSGTLPGCTVSLDRTIEPAGDAMGTGVCGNGTDPKGFALTVDGTVSLQGTCIGSGGSQPPIQLALTLSGTVAVAAE